MQIMIKLKFKTLVAFLKQIFLLFFFPFIKTSKFSSAKYNQDNKERPLEKACKRHQNFSKEEKSDNMVVNNTKIFQKIKSKNLVFFLGFI